MSVCVCICCSSPVMVMIMMFAMLPLSSAGSEQDAAYYARVLDEACQFGCGGLC